MSENCNPMPLLDEAKCLLQHRQSDGSLADQTSWCNGVALWTQSLLHGVWGDYARSKMNRAPWLIREGGPEHATYKELVESLMNGYDAILEHLKAALRNPRKQEQNASGEVQALKAQSAMNLRRRLGVRKLKDCLSRVTELRGKVMERLQDPLRLWDEQMLLEPVDLEAPASYVIIDQDGYAKEFVLRRDLCTSVDPFTSHFLRVLMNERDTCERAYCDFLMGLPESTPGQDDLDGKERNEDTPFTGFFEAELAQDSPRWRDGLRRIGAALVRNREAETASAWVWLGLNLLRCGSGTPQVFEVPDDGLQAVRNLLQERPLPPDSTSLRNTFAMWPGFPPLIEWALASVALMSWLHLTRMQLLHLRMQRTANKVPLSLKARSRMLKHQIDRCIRPAADAMMRVEVQKIPHSSL